ncbi:MAG: M67 family metallopeptidase [Acidobacteriota bacterium]|nr:M67 family metallopeptidase [Acidobacteriota bacterium]
MLAWSIYTLGVNVSIRVPKRILEEMIAHARCEPSIECCGLLAGRDGAITRIFSAANVAENPATLYEIAPREIFERMREMRAEGIELLGVYHSHPNGQNQPSQRDIERAYYSEAAYFIVSPRENGNPVRAFSIREGRVEELKIVSF